MLSFVLPCVVLGGVLRRILCFLNTSVCCPTGQVRQSELTKNYYSFPSSIVTFDNAIRFSAEASFAGVQGRLWAPSSYFELHVIPSSHGFMMTWCGFSDAAVEGKWAVMTGPYIGTDMFELIPWWNGEPNGGTGENCAAFLAVVGGIIDVPCHSILRYIIEFECPFGQRFNDQGTACIGMLGSGCFVG